MGAGGLNGELRNQSDQVDAIFRYHFGFPPNDLRTRSTPQQGPNNNPSASSTTSQAFAGNSRSSPTNSTVLAEEMVCYLCSVNFTLFKRKSLCNSCRKTLCTNCFTQGVNSRDRVLHCITCRALASPVIYKDFLKNLKVKDLQGYLETKHVSTSHCKEKRDLIELILQYCQARVQPDAPTAPTRSTPQGDQSTRQNQSGQYNRNPYVGLFARPTDAGIRVSGSMSSTQQSQAQNSPLKKKTPGKTIDDITDIDQVGNLTVKELKNILTANFVDFKGCVEKQELLEKVRLLWKSKKADKPKGDQEDLGDDVCKVCMDNSIDCVLLECGHMVACIECSKQLVECPICRQHILRIVRVFKA